jgi:hypothetical protein
MAIREEARELVALGPLPDSDTAGMEQMQRLQAAIERISAPVTREEGEALLTGARSSKGEMVCGRSSTQR